ncbi:hypothetical protein GMOD_00005837 [Pyrenophora seminiperda CCB06]|uniref:Uncharacterized protein n=1 Tax=Pyrenophora seminiperda CCB06 TaxID=1302712 RepID=A0A3M7M9W1_9PLEO|nr:hypothetical protein GMOD_00005837 [Pyrenophora seminiperda CCB06]
MRVKTKVAVEEKFMLRPSVVPRFRVSRADPNWQAGLCGLVIRTSTASASRNIATAKAWDVYCVVVHPDARNTTDVSAVLLIRERRVREVRIDCRPATQLFARYRNGPLTSADPQRGHAPITSHHSRTPPLDACVPGTVPGLGSDLAPDALSHTITSIATITATPIAASVRPTRLRSHSTALLAGRMRHDSTRHDDTAPNLSARLDAPLEHPLSAVPASAAASSPAPIATLARAIHHASTLASVQVYFDTPHYPGPSQLVRDAALFTGQPSLTRHPEPA